MVELAYFTQAIRLASSSTGPSLDPSAFSEDLYWIEYSLLSIPNANSNLPEQAVDKACRMGGLLYAKAVLQEFPHSVTGASVLTHQLRESLYAIYMTGDNASLLVWLALLGAMSSKGEDRAWFIIYLKQSSNICGILPFDDEALPLSRFFDLRQGFGRLLDVVWEDMLTNISMADPLVVESGTQTLS